MPKLRMWNGTTWELVDTNAIKLAGKQLSLSNINHGETIVYDQSADCFVPGFAGGGGGDSFDSHRNRVRLQSAASRVHMDIPQLLHGRDILLVFQNGMYLHEGLDYTVTSNYIQLVSGQWEAGTIIEVIVCQIANSAARQSQIELPNTAELLAELHAKIDRINEDKEQLSKILESKGIDVTNEESFSSLIEKVSHL